MTFPFVERDPLGEAAAAQGCPRHFDKKNSHQLSPPTEMVTSRFALCPFPTTVVKTDISLQEKFVRNV